MVLRKNFGRGPAGWLAAVALGFGAGVFAGSGVTTVTAEHARPAPAAAPPVTSAAAAPASATRYPVEVLRVFDGDTFEARVQVWPGIDITTKVRLRGIDAPELRARCEDERIKAEAARDALAAILGEGGVSIVRVGLDKYGGRVLADASTRTVPAVSDAMLQARHARAYAGGRRQPWCGDVIGAAESR